ncbi:MAG: hypothetical protein AAGC53_15400, partial [Actinomycetota bacterium]
TEVVLDLRPLAAAPNGDDLAPVAGDTSLADQILETVRAAGLAEPDMVVDFLLDELDAEPLLDRLPAPMSRGERQICALLITLAVPRVDLALVDPTAGLDGRRRRVVAEVLADLTDQMTITVWSDDPVFR